MSFRQAYASIIGNQRAMVELRRSQIQGLVKQELAGGGSEQIFTADNFGDGHGSIVHNYREWIGRQTVVTPNDEITKVLAGDEIVRPRAIINKRDGFAIRDLKAPIDASAFTADYIPF